MPDSNDTSATIKTGILDWVKGQPFNNVLIMALLCMIGWLGWYAITKAIPDHLTTIQTGYERIETRQTEQLKDQQQTFEKVLDRVFARQEDNNKSAVAGKP